MPTYEFPIGYCGEPPLNITGTTKNAYLLFSKFDWCQIRQAFAEELYSAYRTSKKHEFGTENWLDAYNEGQSVVDILKQNYSDTPMFIGAYIDEVDWNRLWCIAWWYSRHSTSDRNTIRNNLKKRTYPLDTSFEDVTITDELVNPSACREREFISEVRHDKDPDCIPIPRGWGEKILALLGGVAIGAVGLTTFIVLSSKSKSEQLK